MLERKREERKKESERVRENKKEKERVRENKKERERHQRKGTRTIHASSLFLFSKSLITIIITRGLVCLSAFLFCCYSGWL